MTLPDMIGRGAATLSSDGVGSAWGGSSRREFLTLAAKGAAALGMATTLGGCAIAAAGSRKFDFRDDFGILNFAYALETLESRFYVKVCEAPPADLRPGELQVLQDIRDHELAHRRFLKRSLQILRVEVPMSVWPGIDFTSRMSVLTAARNFEDLGVAGYNGAGTHIRLAEFLTIAGKIVSVEARHAAALRDLLNPNSRDFAGDDVIDEMGMDRALEPGEVLAQTQKYFAEPYTAVGL
ncbi:MAG: ferritin-like domain-containing protein [Gemmatimonadota bacterium]|nr:ferritin-like domain-containing protein [Gemmatimonadota bacterium]